MRVGPLGESLFVFLLLRWVPYFESMLRVLSNLQSRGFRGVGVGVMVSAKRRGSLRFDLLSARLGARRVLFFLLL